MNRVNVMIDGSLKKANYTYTAVALDRECGKCTAYDDNGAIIGEITGTIDDITGEQKRFFNCSDCVSLPEWIECPICHVRGCDDFHEKNNDK